jgi:type IX secretion system PorP/SprF family membrane protein
MKHKIWLCGLVLMFFSAPNFAQDQANFTQFYLNPYLINPSFAGIDGQSAFSVIYRKQWMNIDGGPAIANVSLHTPLNERASVGISITNDKRGILTNSGALISFAYSLPLADHSNIRFGLSAGGAWNMVDTELLDTNDPATLGILNQGASLSGNAGIAFNAKSFHFGVSMPTIFSPSYVSTDAFTVTEVKPFQSIIVHASNRFYFNNNQNIFEPYAIYRLNTGLPSQFEVAGIVHLNHVVWAGGSYKQDFGISALAGIKLQNMFAIGASYSLKNTGINELNSPSFEISLGFLFGKHKKGTHAYSFVNTVKEKEKKLSPAALAAKRKAELEKLKAQQALAKAKQDEAKRQAEDKRKADEAKKNPVVVADTKPPVVKKDSVPIVHNPRFRPDVADAPVSIEKPEHHEDEAEKIKRLEEHAEDPTARHGQENEAHPHAERHEFVKRGSHKEELDVADYVIGGVFKSDANAKHFADGLLKLGFKADYGHLTEKNLWYVYLAQTTDINQARAERDRLRKLKIFRDAWLLTVHH